MTPSQAISKHIAPLLLSHGFSILSQGIADKQYWTFGQSDLEIALALDPRNHELSISLHDRRYARPIEFWLVGKFVGDSEAAKLGAVMLSREHAEAGVRQIAAALERNIEILSGWNPQLADDLYARQAALSEAGLRQQRLMDALRLSETYWQSKDFSRFVEVLLPFEGDLSPATLKKIRYAQTHMC